MSLGSVRGQEHAIEVIRRALMRERVHHAYLFAGPEGVGKGMAACAFAQALLCVEPGPHNDACGRCNACMRSLSGQHADLHFIERQPKKDGALDRQIKISQIRALQKSLSFKAYEGHRRVVLISEPERMTPATANALLKTLEEPGKDTHFILVSDAAHRLLPTVISRCQGIRFAPLSDQLVAELIAEQTDLTDGAVTKTIARLSEGSAGRALTMVQEDVISRRHAILGQLDLSEHRPIAETLDLAEDLARPNQREGLPQVFHILRTWYRDLLITKQAVGGEHLVNVDQAQRLAVRAGELSADDLQNRLQRVNDAERAILERMSNARLVLESLFVYLTGPHPQGGMT